MNLKGDFGFQYPWALLALILIPAFIIWMLFSQRQYWRDAFTFSKVSLLNHLKHNRHPILNQRILPICLIAALLFGIIGLAQPLWKTKVMVQNTYLMLVLDISISMEATDLSPNRLTAAKQAAIEFTRDLPDGVKTGLAFFAGNTWLVSPPTTDHKQIIDYLDSLQMEDLRPGTAIGDALMTADDSLQTTIQHEAAIRPKKSHKTQPPQSYMILMTDGESNLGIPPQVALETIAKHHVTVFTVGMGQGSGAYVRGGIFTQLDEPTLQSIATQTGGEYYRAQSFGDFKDIYRKIGRKTLSFEEKTINLTPWCLALAMLLTIAALTWTITHRRF